MSFAFLQDPFNPLGKWAAKPLWGQILVLVVLFSAAIFTPVLDYFALQKQLDDLSQEQAQTAQTLHNQQKILNALQQQSAQQNLSPELAAQTMPINQRLQQIAQYYGLEMHFRWEFAARAHLHLQITGAFGKTSGFLTALLRNEPMLELTHLQFSKNEQGALQSEMQFQLDKDK